jgi:ketosteroid isomerase-like protein
MQRILLTILLAVSLVRFVKAQEMTGEKAEEVKKEILEMDQEKIAALTGPRSVAADWSRRVDADGLAFTSADGSMLTKAEHLAQFWSGERKALSLKDDDFRVHVYANGDTAVLTYRANTTIELKGKASTHQNRITDVYVKENGAWRRIVHHVTGLPTHGPESESKTD